MTLNRIPLRAVPREEFPVFFKHLCPPTFGGDAIDPVTPTRRVNVNLDIQDNFVVGPDGTRVRMWLLEDPDADNEQRRTFPGKLIRTVEGDVVHARVGARLNTHTIHWHGIEPTPMNDGVGKHSFEISGNFVYQFATRQAGTFFYHCHKNTALHFEMGLYGPLIIDPKKPNTPEAQGVPDPPYPFGGPGFVAGLNPPTNVIKYDVEALWVPDDIDLRWHELGHDAFMHECDKNNPLDPGGFTKDGILNDFRSDVIAISGEMKMVTDSSPFEKAIIKCNAGQTVLLRFIDASYTVQEIRLGLPWTLVAQDGFPLGVGPTGQYNRPIEFAAGQPMRITAAMRGDAIIRPTQKGRFPCTIDFFHWVSKKKLYTATTFIDVE
jgi:FtsP/CotA-like multicopper oxidase with cupredoxin domain